MAIHVKHNMLTLIILKPHQNEKQKNFKLYYTRIPINTSVEHMVFKKYHIILKGPLH